MPLIEIHCPTCSKKGRIEISEDMSDVKRGLIAVNISSGKICPHSFIAYVDKNLVVRDYFKADFQIQVSTPTEQEKKETPTELVDLDVLKMNITPAIISYMIRGIFLKQEIVLILEHEYLFNHVLNFFKFITQNSFDFHIKLVSLDNYMKSKKKYKKYIVLGRNEILRDDKKIIDLKKLKNEKKIVEKFFEETGLMSSLIILKNEIQRVYDLSETAVNYLKDFRSEKKGEAFNRKNLIDHLREKKDMKITSTYMDFLLEIINSYFGESIPKEDEVSGFLGFL